MKKRIIEAASAAGSKGGIICEEKDDFNDRLRRMKKIKKEKEKNGRNKGKKGGEKNV